MRKLLKGLAICLLLFVAAGGAAIFVLTDRQALVSRSDAISPATVAQARRLFDTNDPRRLRPGEIRTVVIPVSLIDEGVNYLAGRYLHGRASFAPKDGQGGFDVSVALPANRFANLQVLVRSVNGRLQVQQARLGPLSLPASLIEQAIVRLIATAGYQREWQLAGQSLLNVAFDARSSHALVTYRWEPRILDHARTVALEQEDIAYLEQAHLAFAASLAHRSAGSAMPLADVLQAQFPAPGETHARRARAVLLVLAAYLAEKDLASLVPQVHQWPRLKWVNITLAGRHDLAQHFVVSAALAAWAGEPVADAIGLYKELQDARHGSGFSFIDLSADRAGTRFGEKAIVQPAELSARLRTPLADKDLLPPVADLPEDLHNPAFSGRFHNHESREFKAMAAEIERRLSTLPLYR